MPPGNSMGCVCPGIGFSTVMHYPAPSTALPQRHVAHDLLEQSEGKKVLRCDLHCGGLDTRETLPAHVRSTSPPGSSPQAAIRSAPPRPSSATSPASSQGARPRTSSRSGCLNRLCAMRHRGGSAGDDGGSRHGNAAPQRQPAHPLTARPTPCFILGIIYLTET